ncbi:MAG: cytochrome c [Ginsengibacter sp.]
MKTKNIIIYALVSVISLGIIGINSCEVSKKVQAKTGTQLWGENCGRCHNAPGPGEFNNTNWDIVGTHMRIRTNITETEEKKIVAYLISTNN